MMRLLTAIVRAASSSLCPEDKINGNEYVHCTGWLDALIRKATDLDKATFVLLF